MEAIARLRMSVFRAFPYLYNGDMEYEKKRDFLAQGAGHMTASRNPPEWREPAT